LVRPKDYRFSPTYFEFKYGIEGEMYPWYESYFVGPDGMTYFIAAISIAGFIGLILIIAIIMCVVKCVNSAEGANKVHDISEAQKLEPGNSSGQTPGSVTPGGAALDSSRNPSLYNPTKDLGFTGNIL
jgi:hypothetical protein